MDDDDLQIRVITFLTAARDVDEDAIEQLGKEFQKLHRELSVALVGSQDKNDLADLLRAIEVHHEVMTDPSLQESFAFASASGLTPEPEIFEAIAEGDVSAVRAALATCDVNMTQGTFEATPLYRAMSGYEISLEVIHFLLDAGADPRKGLTETNVLHGLGFAIIRDVSAVELSKVVERCVALGADIEERTDHLHWTPLITAVSEMNPIAAEALLLAGADINARAGEVPGVYFSGSDVFEFAEGDDEMLAVLHRVRNRVVH